MVAAQRWQNRPQLATPYRVEWASIVSPSADVERGRVGGRDLHVGGAWAGGRAGPPRQHRGPQCVPYVRHCSCFGFVRRRSSLISRGVDFDAPGVSILRPKGGRVGFKAPGVCIAPSGPTFRRITPKPNQFRAKQNGARELAETLPILCKAESLPILCHFPIVCHTFQTKHKQK